MTPLQLIKRFKMAGQPQNMQSGMPMQMQMRPQQQQQYMQQQQGHMQQQQSMQQQQQQQHAQQQQQMGQQQQQQMGMQGMPQGRPMMRQAMGQPGPGQSYTQQNVGATRAYMTELIHTMPPDYRRRFDEAKESADKNAVLNEWRNRVSAGCTCCCVTV